MTGSVPTVSPTSICNQAFSWIGEKRINSLEEQSRQAQWMRENYYPCRDACLETRSWTFAIAREFSDVAPDENASEVETWAGQYQHLIPNSWLRVTRVYRNVQSADPREWLPSVGWSREGQYIYTDESQVWMYGIDRVDDPGKWTPAFVQVVAARLAAEAAIVFTGNRQLSTDMWTLYGAKLEEASSSDAQQGRYEKVRRGSLIKSRIR